LHAENETRQLFIQIDESEEVTRAILKKQAQEAMYGVLDSHHCTQELWQEFLLGLEPKPVVVLFGDQLAESFPICRVRSRRDFPKLLEMIKTSAYLNQKQRDQSDDLIVASVQDYYQTKPLFEHCYRFGPDSHTTTLLMAARLLGREFTSTDLQGRLGWGKTKTYEVLQRCLETGSAVDGGSRGRYRLVNMAARIDLQLPEVLE
jgi:hypothetical protein